MMVKLPSLLTLTGLLLSSSYAATDSTVEGCGQFKVNGTWQEYFNFYRHYDFRYTNPSSKKIGTSSWPKNRYNETELQQFSRYTDASWTDGWSIRTANKSPANKKLIPLNYVPENVFMTESNGRGLLTLNTSLLSNNTQLGGEMFWRPADVDAVSMRLSARVTGDTGAVAVKSSEVNVSFEASTLMIDMWSNGGSWSGDMPVWGEAKLEIQWIELAFNASTLEPLGVPKKGIVCQIDPLGDNDGSQRDDDEGGFMGKGVAGESSTEAESAAMTFKAGLGSSIFVSIAAVMLLFCF